MTYLIECVELACNRQIAQAGRKMNRGLWCLAAISSSAFFVGSFGTVVGILNSFRSYGTSKSTILASTTRGLAQALIPTLFALLVAIVSYWGYRFLTNRMRELDQEMNTATVSLVNQLVVHLRNTGDRDATYPRRDRRAPCSLVWKDVPAARSPQFEMTPMFRHGIAELFWPRLQSRFDADSMLAASMWILFAYAAIAWLVCLWQGRSVAGVIVASFLLTSGLGIRAGSKWAAIASITFFGFAFAACLVAFGLTLSAGCLAVASILLAGSIKACCHSSSARDEMTGTKQLWQSLSPLPGFLLTALSVSAALAMLFGTILNHYPIGRDSSMEPNVHPGDWIVGWSQSMMRAPLRGELVTFRYWGAIGVERIAGTAGDQIEVRSGTLFRNGRRIVEPYVLRRPAATIGNFPLPSESYPDEVIRWEHELGYPHNLRTDTRFVVPADSYFLLNDNRSELLDSRIFGPLTRGRLAGTPWLAYNPSWREYPLLRFVR